MIPTLLATFGEIQNKHRSHAFVLATLNTVPIYWKSSIIQCYANEDFDEDHPDRSSARSASEAQVAANATDAVLHLPRVACEAGVPFPKPFILKMNNDAARVFANDTCFHTCMKHIDCAQNWVRILRDKTICIPTRANWLTCLLRYHL